jgi:serine/threonine protein kinase
MDQATNLIGRRIGGRFLITGLLGEGAMAAVYRAEQATPPTHVAVKVMHDHLVHDAGFVGRFKREARAASMLSHPNVVEVLAYGVDEGRLYLAMALLEGHDLYEVIARDKRLSEARTAALVAQVCDALEAAHAAGIVHRDLKPENIFVSKQPDGAEHVRVLDFGIAKILERERDLDAAPPSSEALTTVGMLIGTPEYMSPEQCGGGPLDARSDIYACGIVMFHMLTGRPPFVDEFPPRVALMHLGTDAPLVRQLVPTVDPRLEKIVARCLEKRPEDRYQTARELGDALRTLGRALKSAVAEGVEPPPRSRAALSIPAHLLDSAKPPISGIPSTQLHVSLSAFEEAFEPTELNPRQGARRRREPGADHGLAVTRAPQAQLAGARRPGRARPRRDARLARSQRASQRQAPARRGVQDQAAPEPGAADHGLARRRGPAGRAAHQGDGRARDRAAAHARVDPRAPQARRAGAAGAVERAGARGGRRLDALRPGGRGGGRGGGRARVLVPSLASPRGVAAAS